MREVDLELTASQKLDNLKRKLDEADYELCCDPEDGLEDDTSIRVRSVLMAATLRFDSKPRSSARSASRTRHRRVEH